MPRNILLLRQFWYSKNVLCNLVLSCQGICIYPTPHNYNKKSIIQTPLLDTIRRELSVSAMNQFLCFVIFAQKWTLSEAILVLKNILYNLVLSILCICRIQQHITTIQESFVKLQWLMQLKESPVCQQCMVAYVM